ncbi:MAG: tetratricopeptide repeat protein, partial [Planctomycetes bacterium]|nr:tetratricopeptide repeat protein [Planctomycetota bacterium]
LPRDRRVLLYRGWARLRAGELEEAQRTFRQVVTHSRRSAAGWISLGIARLEDGDRGGAADLAHGIALHQDVLAGAAAGSSAGAGDDLLFAGAAHFYLGDFEAAAQAFRALVAADERSFAGWYHIALSEYYRGEIAAARAALRRAAALHPENLWVTWLDAEILSAEGISDVRRLLSEHKARIVGNPALLLRCGRLLEAAGQREEGRAWTAEAAARLFPGAADACTIGAFGRVSVPSRNVLWYGPPSPAGSEEKAGG